MNLGGKPNRPNFGDGTAALVAAIIYQALYDCKYGDSQERLEAWGFLQGMGRSWWDLLRLAPDLYDRALVDWVPGHLRNGASSS